MTKYIFANVVFLDRLWEEDITPNLQSLHSVRHWSKYTYYYLRHIFQHSYPTYVLEPHNLVYKNECLSVGYLWTLQPLNRFR